MKRGDFSLKPTLRIKSEELKKERREKSTHYFLFTLFTISLLLLTILLTLHILNMTGFVSYIESKAGYITEVSVHYKTNTSIWGGVYGLALRVPEFTQQLSESLVSGNVQRSDVFFDCLKSDAQGGPEIYASTNSTLTISSSTVQPGTAEMVDSFIGCNGEVFCADQTFIRNMTIFAGSTNITNIPSTNTYRYDGKNEIFDVGVLNISGNLAFVAHVNKTIQKGYNPNVIVNYQMLLPTPANTTQTYYFYADDDFNLNAMNFSIGYTRIFYKPSKRRE